jgi:hypothetical protein
MVGLSFRFRGSFVHCVRPRRDVAPAGDLLSCIDKKVGKEATPADSALAAQGLPCAARSLQLAPNSLRGLRPLRSDKRREVRGRSVLRTQLQSPALLSSSEGGDEHQIRLASHRLHGLGYALPMRSEACGSLRSNDRIALGPRGWRRGAQGFGAARVSAHQQLTSRRLSERRERSEQSEFGARPQTPSTAEQSASGRPPPSGPPFFAYFLSGKRKKVSRLSGRHPDTASRSEQKPHANAGTRLRYLSPNGRWYANQASTGSARTVPRNRAGSQHPSPNSK